MCVTLQTALSCIPPLEQTNLKNHNTKSDQVDAAATAKQVTANLQEQVCVLEEQKVIMFASCMFSLCENMHVHHDV